jgi:Polyketide cyclase / dehydrase and lipid transport
MSAIVGSIEIARRPDDVFAYVTDASQFPDWQESVVAARREGDAPLAVGTRTVVTRRVGRRAASTTEELTELQPPGRWGFRARIPGYAAAPRPLVAGSLPAGQCRHWESREALQAATAATELQERIRAVTAAPKVPISAHPARYRVAVEFCGSAPDQHRTPRPPAHLDPS